MNFLSCPDPITIVDNVPTCESGWSTSVAGADVDPFLLSLAFGGGVSVYLTFWIAFFGFKMLLKAIKTF